MGVELEIVLTNGWKAEENNRHGKVLVLRFINDKNRQTLFEWAPRLEDREVVSQLFRTLEEYDKRLVEYREAESSLNAFLKDFARVYKIEVGNDEAE